MTDQVLTTIADYVYSKEIVSEEAYDTAILCLADALGCAILSLKFKECTKLLGPVIPMDIPSGSRVPGTNFVLDPVQAAFNIGTMIRWLDYNDTWLAAEWGHPSDNLGGLLAISDYINRNTAAAPLKVKDLLTAMIKAYEIQGQIALQNSFNRIGLDHVILVKIATAAVSAGLLGLTHEQIVDVISNAFADAGPLRTYRHAPNTGSRKSWAAGDQTSRGVMFALMGMKGEMGYHEVLGASKWGFYDVLFQGKPLLLDRPFGSYVMENILFKISYPAEFHAQTAVECAVKLHQEVVGSFHEIESIRIMTHESALRIIDKKGKLNNPADRDHCLQYMVAVALLKGNLTANDYHEKTASDPLIDELRERMVVVEEKRFTKEYMDADKRSIANGITIAFKDGTQLESVVVEYPIGHRLRREAGVPLLMNKFRDNLETHYEKEKVGELVELFQDRRRLEAMDVSDFIALFV